MKEKKIFLAKRGADNSNRTLLLMCDKHNEIGVFLGYPIEDVIKFEQTGGKDYSYNGLQKVYDNVDTSIKIMNMYKKCSVQCNRLFEKGFGIQDISRVYKKINKKDGNSK